MYATLQIVTTMAVAVAMSLSLAHALELPGKRRLDQATYTAVQPIYYPGFTIAAAFGEFGGLILTVLLLILTPPPTPAFWLTALAAAAMLAMTAIYWLITHRTNQIWLKHTTLTPAGAKFFSTGPNPDPEVDWTHLRDRWEYSHVARAALAVTSLLALLIALQAD